MEDRPRVLSELQSALLEFSAAFDFGIEQLCKLQAFENEVFEVEGEDRILRVSHQTHRQPQDLDAEFHWVNFLRERGMPVSAALPANSGSLVVTSSDQGYSAVMIEKVPGVQMSALPQSEWTPKYFAEWGRTIGRMHKLTRSYEAGSRRRMSWDDDRYVLNFREFVNGQGDIYIRNWERLLEELSCLHKSAENYGLIHDDLHTKNFCMHQGRLQVFDTDDCKYNFFMADVVSALHSIVLHDEWFENHELEEFLTPFWEGYCGENELTEEMREQLPVLMRARSAVVFGAVCHKWDLQNLNDRQQFVFDSLRGSLADERPLGFT